MSGRMSRAAQVLLGDAAIFVAIGAVLGVFAAALWSQSGAIGPVLLAAAAIALSIGLRRRIGRALQTGAEAAARASGLQIDASSARRPLDLAAPAIVLAAASAAPPFSGAGAWLIAQAAATMVLVVVFWALARLIGQIAAAAVRSWSGAAAPRWVETLAQSAVVLVGGATILELWGAPAAAAVGAVAVLGLAAALGGRERLRDLIAGATLRHEDRLRVGDWVEIVEPSGGVLAGHVVSLGARTTRLRRADGAELETPNGVLLDRTVVLGAREDVSPKTAAPKAVKSAAAGATTRATKKTAASASAAKSAASDPKPAAKPKRRPSKKPDEERDEQAAGGAEGQRTA